MEKKATKFENSIVERIVYSLDNNCLHHGIGSLSSDKFLKFVKKKIPDAMCIKIADDAIFFKKAFLKKAITYCKKQIKYHKNEIKKYEQSINKITK